MIALRRDQPALFVSDMHLSDAHPRTVRDFLATLHEHSRDAAFVFLLGDLFDAWVGDDTLGSPDAEACVREFADALQRLSARGTAVYAMRGNRDFLLDIVARELPGVTVEAPIEATYLAWLNVSALQLPDPIAHFEAHGVGLSDGTFFGAPRGSHVRLNFGCPRATLTEALARMKRALATR